MNTVFKFSRILLLESWSIAIKPIVKLDLALKWLFVLGLAYVIYQSYLELIDFNVYWYAAKQLLEGKNIYSGNIFNNYLYSPFFAFVMKPFTSMNYIVSGMVWNVLNYMLLWRIFILIIKMQRRNKNYLERINSGQLLVLIGISAAAINFNIILGQITILMLWCMLEGLWQQHIGNKNEAAMLIAFGALVKIYPIICLLYLFSKGNYSLLFKCVLLIFIGLFLPGFFIGASYNNYLLVEWVKSINPLQAHFALEANNSCMSLSSTLLYLQPYFKFDVAWISKILSVLIVTSLFYFFYIGNRKKHANIGRIPFNYLFEVGLLCFAIVLLFPHQLKYSVLLIMPSTAWLLLMLRRTYTSFVKRKKVSIFWVIWASTTVISLGIIALFGRDILGEKLYLICNQKHLMGFALLMLYALLCILGLKPKFSDRNLS